MARWTWWPQPAAGSFAPTASLREMTSIASARPHQRQVTDSTLSLVDRRLLDLVVTGEVEVPVLRRTAGAGDVEAGEVAAAGAAPAVRGVGDHGAHRWFSSGDVLAGQAQP